MAKKVKIKYSVLDDERREDFALGYAMLAVKNSKVVSEESILKKLKR